MNTLANYTEADVRTWLGKRELDKGRSYLRAVSDLFSDGDTLTARVQGTAPKPYVVSLRIHNHPWAGRGLQASCTCPVGSNCKHVAATLLAWLEQRRDPNRPREQVLAWVEAFRLASAPEVKPARSSSATHGLRYVLRFHPETRQYVVSCFKVRLDRNGQIRGDESWSNFERALDAPHPSSMIATSTSCVSSGGTALVVWPTRTPCQWQGAIPNHYCRSCSKAGASISRTWAIRRSCAATDARASSNG